MSEHLTDGRTDNERLGPHFTRTVLTFNGADILLISDHPFAASRFKGLGSTVTGLCVSDGEQGINPVGTLYYQPSETVGVTYSDDNKELIISGPEDAFGEGTALAFVAQYMAECLRDDSGGSMLVHAAAVSIPDTDSSYIIFGDKGAGKTTLALRLCHQHGFQLIGNDQIYLGSPEEGKLIVDGGNKWFDVRQTAILSDPYLKELFKEEVNNHPAAWNNKRRVYPEEIGIKALATQTVVRKLFHIRIDHTQPGIHAETWNGLQRSLYVHELLGRHISGQATPLLDDNGSYLGSLPPIEFRKAALKKDVLVQSILSSGLTEIFANNSDLAVDYVLEENDR